MLERIKNLLLYARLTPEQFHKVKPLVESENAFALKLAAVIQILYFGISFMSSWSLAEMSDKKLVYGTGTFVPFMILIIHLIWSKKYPSLQRWLVFFFSLGICEVGLLCTLVCTPDEMTILLLIFFFCIPMIFVIRPLDQIIIVLITIIVYFAVAPSAKTADILTMDMIDVAMFSTLSVILGVSHMQGRYRRYWLETEAVDLAEIRYQAAFKDQLTDVFNRNAYNKDTEKFETLALPADFMYIAMDLNGLKAANDTFGHVAGDELLIGASECMKKCFSEYGTVYRTGGDEFIILMNTKGREEGEILSTFNKLVDDWTGTLVQKLSVSYGVVMASEAKNFSFHEIELLADKRMYQSKSDYYKNSGIERRKN